MTDTTASTYETPEDIAAAETAIAISIIINIYREVGNSDVASVKQMRF